MKSVQVQQVAGLGKIFLFFFLSYSIVEKVKGKGKIMK
jgi:hypothetical protein